jgi:PAS domain S-box-containing protein
MRDLPELDFDVSPFFEMTPDLVCIASKEGFFKKVNRAVVDKLKYDLSELLSVPIASFIHPDDRELTRGERNKLLDGRPLINFQNRYVTKTGEIVWLQWTSIYFPDKEVVFAIAKDVTERKKLEQETEEKYAKFKSLSKHFKSSIEKDRKYLAFELQEELAQLAIAIKVDLDSIGDNLPGLSDFARTRVEHATAVSELLIRAIRRITFAISPDLLYDFGLNEALEWLCKEFSLLSGIRCDFEKAYNEADITETIKLDLFRICQESLRNIVRHAHATSAKINLIETDNRIRLSIIDDGNGFVVKEKAKSPGLISMRDRAASINGKFKVKSAPGKGTVVSVEIPGGSAASE